MLNVAVLLPGSTMYPTIGFDFNDGLKSCVQYYQAENNFSFYYEQAGFGSNQKELYSKVESILLQKQVQVVVAYIEFRMAELLQPLFEGMNKLLVVVNAGANVPNPAKHYPNMILLSTEDAFHCYLTGKMAVDSNTEGIMCASYYDAGYKHCSSMTGGFMNNSGSIIFNSVSPLKLKEFNLKSLTNYITENNKYDAVLLCIFSAEYAGLFLNELGKNEIADRLTLYLSPMLLEEALQKNITSAVPYKTAKGFTAWISTLENMENKIFKEAFIQNSQRQPNRFAVLGWEAALLLEVVEKFIQANNSPTVAEITTHLNNITLQGPRGRLKFNNGVSRAPVYEVKLENPFLPVLVKEISLNEEEQDAFYKKPADQIESGWYNTFLCA
jgi:branched-chain amino acid transport system substrate-binding protein